jgi:hypothetical protein
MSLRAAKWWTCNERETMSAPRSREHGASMLQVMYVMLQRVHMLQRVQGETPPWERSAWLLAREVSVAEVVQYVFHL